MMSVAELWEIFIKECLGGVPLSPIEIGNLRNAFYCGAFGLNKILQEVAELDGPEAVNVLKALDGNLKLLQRICHENSFNHPACPSTTFPS